MRTQDSLYESIMQEVNSRLNKKAEGTFIRHQASADRPGAAEGTLITEVPEFKSATASNKRPREKGRFDKAHSRVLKQGATIESYYGGQP